MTTAEWVPADPDEAVPEEAVPGGAAPGWTSVADWRSQVNAILEQAGPACLPAGSVPP
jgi:hypothetical protein